MSEITITATPADVAARMGRDLLRLEEATFIRLDGAVVPSRLVKAKIFFGGEVHYADLSPKGMFHTWETGWYTQSSRCGTFSTKYVENDLLVRGEEVTCSECLRLGPTPEVEIRRVVRRVRR